MPNVDDLAEQLALAERGGAPEKSTDIVEAAKPPLGGVFTRSMDGWAMDPRWLDQIAVNSDKVLAEEGYSPDLALYDGLLDDDIAMSAFQQRRLDVISKDWIVEPGADDAQSKAAADHLRENLKRIAWDEICSKMLFANWYGYGVGEAIWQIGADGLLELATVYVPNRGWFGFSNAGQLVFRDPDQPEGTPVPDRKFWTIRAGATHDAQFYGIGLAHYCYWPIYFKRNSVKFWALFLEKFGMPTVLGKFPPGWENDTQKLNDFLAALSAIGTDAAVTVPDGASVDAFEGARSGSGASSYKEFVDVMNAALTRVILSQTMTSEAGPAGLGSGQAEVQERKGLALAQSDSDLLHESFTGTIAKWLTEWNFPGAATPRVYRKLQDDEDLTALVERDAKLDELGWQRTEKSFRETYGEGYERKPEPAPPPALVPPVPAAGNDNRKPPANNQRQLAFAAQFAARDPQPLYIMRKLLNGKELLDWARSQGFANLEKVNELHATVLYCRTPVDWFELANQAFWTPETVKVEAGGPRAVEPLGDKGVIVLQFACWELESRHRGLIEAGATHGHENYWPHVTFAFDAEGVDLAEVEPFRGELRFGPEIWEPLDSDGEFQLNLPAVNFAAEQLDAIDRLTFALADQGQAALRAMIAPVRESLAGLSTTDDPEALRVALLQAMERMDTSEFAAVLADPLVAVRAVEEAGLGSDTVA